MSTTALVRQAIQAMAQQMLRRLGVSVTSQVTRQLRRQIEQVLEEESSLLDTPSYAERFFGLCDALDRRLNGEVEWRGATVAQPWGKRVSFERIMYVTTWAVHNVPALEARMREGTEYDPANLPPPP